jgi:DNA topoisomerase-1
METSIRTSQFLIIVESPSKCAKIETFINIKNGPSYKCVSTRGHIREIADGLNDIQFTEKSVNIKFNLIKEKRAHINQLKNIIQNYRPYQIFLATDDDREGEAIAWHICQVFGLPIADTPRIVFHEITRDAIHIALANPRRVCMQTVAAQHARQVMDILVGYTVSPFLWSNISTKEKRILSAGRCQTPALRLVYDHHVAPKRDVNLRFEVSAHFLSVSNPIVFTAAAPPPPNYTIPQFFELSRNLPHILSSETPYISTRRAPQPLNTSRILQHASNRLHTSPKQTMELCQELYQQGFITYLRTESTQYASEFINTANEYMSKLWGVEYINPEQSHLILSPVAGGDTPHEAIRVTRPEIANIPRVDKIPKLHLMYRLIWERTMESLMTDARYEVTKLYMTAQIPVPEETSNTTIIQYSSTMEVPKFLGWERVASLDTMDSAIAMKHMCIKNCLSIPDAFYTPLFMETVARATGVPTPHYSESTLIQHLEEYGIGRPSTYAGIIHTLVERGYVGIEDISGVAYPYTHYMTNAHKIVESQRTITVGQEKQKMVIQPIGIRVIEYLITNFNHLFEYSYTRTMENALDVVDENTWSKMCMDARDTILLGVNAGEERKSDAREQTSVDESGKRPPPVPENVLRYVSTDVSIRTGKYGPYVYYKTDKMKKPTFYSLTKFDPKGHTYMTCESEEILKWLKKTYGRNFS